MQEGHLKVLIVDDEIPLREELRAFPWESCGAVLIGDAENGEDALKKCREGRPDVVVTDITMPVMDGLALTRELRRRHPYTQIILLTCHSEFQYAQEALRLGALEYILKVSLEEDMGEALNKARAAIERNRNHEDNERAKCRAYTAGILGKLIQSAREDAFISQEDWDRLPEGDGGAIQLVQLGLDSEVVGKYVLQQDVQQTLEDIGQEYQEVRASLSISNGEYWMCLNSGDSSVRADQVVREAIRRVQRLAEETGAWVEKEAFVYGIASGAVGCREEFLAAVKSADRWKPALFYDSARETVFYGKPEPLRMMTGEDRRKLEADTRPILREDGKLSEYFQRDFHGWCTGRRINPDDLKKWSVQRLLDGLQERDRTLPVGWDLVRLSQAPTLNRLVSELVYMLRVKGEREEPARVEIRTAKQWIQEHLGQSLTLNTIAEHAGLSPHYLSRLFREEVGESVNQYIIRLRMERAAELLTRTNKKVYEVAEEVGIPSYRYFTVLFRNWYGVAPTDYKGI